MTGHESWASTPAARAAMRGNRSRDTRPELAVRRLLHRAGLRYRVHLRVPEMPRRSIDIAFPQQRLAVFIDGCFWHGCPDHYRPASANMEFWLAKLSENRARDQDSDTRLEEAGWFVLRFWEHENPSDVVAAVSEKVQSKRSHPGEGRTDAES